ncbi:MAG: hypothetical protein AUF65_01375 [Chloroflexi bacterium 13_1_20CM_50_12]|nr:MAG: hypothetical protein AUF65_01375 [Chloroflexi bacterium 13_1_20CM_50_12]
MAGKFQLNWITPGHQFMPGTKVEITEGYLSQRYSDCVEVWIRYAKDGEKVGWAILTPQWEDIKHLRAV